LYNLIFAPRGENPARDATRRRTETCQARGVPEANGKICNRAVAFSLPLLRFCHSVTRFLHLESPIFRHFRTKSPYFWRILHFHYKSKKPLAFPSGICYYANREAQKASFLPGANANGTGEDASGYPGQKEVFRAFTDELLNARAEPVRDSVERPEPSMRASPPRERGACEGRTCPAEANLNKEES